MTGFGKFLVGAAATSLLAFGAHQIGGAKYIDGIEEGVQSAFSQLNLPDGASVAMQRDPLARVAVVNGDLDEATRTRVEAALLAVPGVAAVRFNSGEAAAPAADSADNEAVSTCQSGVDEAMAGKVINFNLGSATVSDDSLTVVDDVAATLKECQGIDIAIGGHTDATGTPAINGPLSQARADAVAAALTERGIAADRMTATGYGSTQLKVPDDGANAANRRIEFKVSATDQGSE